ncbi:hypothetical protein N825_06605 [Skermanella stibiiresistens SB22]|uniref:Uncharacterized protein n=2 Tax=Skermanella TaxID=204447 RepID=W9GZX3_9PROT|nr:hypothetical protein N825_06605 [Skermanella stibiiresistens SB22]
MAPMVTLSAPFPSPAMAGSTASPHVVVHDLADLDTVMGLTIAGHVDHVTVGPEIVLEGWGRLSSGPEAAGAVEIHTDLELWRIGIEVKERPDVVAVVGDPGLRFSGFIITLVPDGESPPLGHHTLCITTIDPVYGRFRMHDNANIPCPVK